MSGPADRLTENPGEELHPPAPDVPERWRIEVDGGDAETIAAGEAFTVGRAAGCDLRIFGDPRLSRRHFTAVVDLREQLTIQDETGG
ncbi:MAG: FHA domain-containing protein, partial [Planctomycetota bacterium]